MRSIIDNIITRRINPLKDYESLRKQLIKWSLIIITVFGAPIVTLGILQSIKLNRPSIAISYALLFIPILVLNIFRNRINHRILASAVLFCIYLFGVHDIATYGFSGSGVSLFLVFFILTTVFFGLRTGLLSILCALIPMGAIAYLMVNGILKVEFDVMKMLTLPSPWITIMGALLFLGLIMVISYSYIHHSLFHIADITKKQANKLKRMNHDLLKEIAERKKTQQALEDALEKAKESEQLKSAFLANMSHEIRTPMNGIVGFVNLLKEPQLTDSKRNKYIDIINKSSERLLNTINDIIDISKIEAGQILITRSTVKINLLLEELHAFFTPETEQKGLEFRKSTPLPNSKATVISDNDKFYRILNNLIKNAIKYTDRGSIEIGYRLQDNGTSESLLEFYVRDTGIGIPINRLQAIFNRFEQADINDVRAMEGSGLGLAISKAYVEMLEGKIWVESEVGKGSDFRFTIPYRQG